MADQVTVTVNAGDVTRKVEVYAERLRGLDMGDVGEELKTQVDDLIQAEGALYGRPRWPDLSNDVLMRRPGAKMLQAKTGLLANVQSNPEPRSVEVSSPAPYAGFHVTGTFTRGGGVRMPKRDFLDVDLDVVLEACGARVLEHLDR